MVRYTYQTTLHDRPEITLSHGSTAGDAPQSRHWNGGRSDSRSVPIVATDPGGRRAADGPGSCRKSQRNAGTAHSPATATGRRVSGQRTVALWGAGAFR